MSARFDRWVLRVRSSTSGGGNVETTGEITREFGDRMRARREEMGLSQEDLAGRCGLHRTYVGSVERGERNVSLINIVRIADALDVDAGWLVRRVGADVSLVEPRCRASA